MATRRKDFTPRNKARTLAALANEFIKDLLDQVIRANRLIVGGTKKKPRKAIGCTMDGLRQYLGDARLMLVNRGV